MAVRKIISPFMRCASLRLSRALYSVRTLFDNGHGTG